MKIIRSNTLTALASEAFEALTDNGFRTTLSLIGVAIGIAAIMVVSSIASSGRTMVFHELETFGLRTFWVFRSTDSDNLVDKEIRGSGIDLSDYRAIAGERNDSIEFVSPIVNSEAGGVFVSKHGKNLRVTLLGVNEKYIDINGDSLAAGRFLTNEDIRLRANVAVIGPEVANKLAASNNDLLGQNININGDWNVVVGILKPKSRDLISSLGAGKEETAARILIPYSTQQKRIGDSTLVSFLQGQASEIERSAEAIDAIIHKLNSRHRGIYKYKSESMATYIATANRILEGVTLIGVVAAMVSLLVGGLAIMNIMTTSVIERTKEIGLRRAIGASKDAIKMQFLMEAVLISMLGGIFGVILGLIIVNVLSSMTPLQGAVSIRGLILALSSSIAVGIASGYYPARKASDMVPVEALRHD